MIEISVNNNEAVVKESFLKLKSKKARNTNNNEVKKFLYNEIVVKKSKFIDLTTKQEFRYYEVLKFLRDELKIDREKFEFEMLDNYHTKHLTITL